MKLVRCNSNVVQVLLKDMDDIDQVNSRLSLPVRIAHLRFALWVRRLLRGLHPLRLRPAIAPIWMATAMVWRVNPIAAIKTHRHADIR